MRGEYYKYPEYKKSNIPFIESIPIHWEIWKATHGYRTIGSGTTPKSDNPEYYNGEIPWITTSELRESIIVDTNKKITDLALREVASLRLYNPGSIAIAMYGATIGRLGVLGIESTVNQACCVFDNPEKFHPRFFYYWLWMSRNTLIAFSSGGGQPNLSQEDLRQLRIPIPDIEEQTLIARYLDQKTGQIDRLIEQKEKLLKLLAEKRTAIITQAVTKGLDPTVEMKDSGIDWLGMVPAHWEVKRLRFLIKTNPVKSEINLPENEIVSFIPMEAVHEYGGISIEIEKELRDVYNGYTYFRNDDVIVAKITPCFENGKGAIASGLKNNIAFGTTELHVLRPKNEIDYEFLFYVTISDLFRKIGESWMYGAGGQKRVPELFIKNYMIQVCEISEQKEIVTWLNKRVKQIHTVSQQIIKSINSLKEYREALITAAVTGQIDVRKEITDE